jgi:hypothetical protein
MDVLGWDDASGVSAALYGGGSGGGGGGFALARGAVGLPDAPRLGMPLVPDAATPAHHAVEHHGADGSHPDVRGGFDLDWYLV